MLGELNCDQFQGYHFGKPMDRDHVAIRLLRSTADSMAEVKQLPTGLTIVKSSRTAS